LIFCIIEAVKNDFGASEEEEEEEEEGRGRGGAQSSLEEEDEEEEEEDEEEEEEEYRDGELGAEDSDPPCLTVTALSLSASCEDVSCWGVASPD
jgi:hypothetical protein